MLIKFTKHAEDKFAVLRRHKFVVSKRQVLGAVRKPDLVDHSRRPLVIAQRKIDKDHVLRVVCKRENEVLKIITFYPGRVKQYEK